MAKATKVPRIIIKNRDPEKISTGANTVVEIDGKPVPYVKSLKYEVNAQGVGELTLKMFGSIELQLGAEKVKASTEILKGDGDDYVLGAMGPTFTKELKDL